MNKNKLIKLLTSLPKDCNPSEVESLRIALENAQDRATLADVEKDVYAKVISWGRLDRGFYDAEILTRLDNVEKLNSDIAKYNSLVDLLKHARNNYEAENQETIDGYNARVAQDQTDIDIAEGRKSTIESTKLDADKTKNSVESKIKATEEKITSLIETRDDGRATYINSKKEEFLIGRYAERYRSSLTGIFGGINRRRFDKLPEGEKARVIEEYLNNSGESYVAFETKNSSGVSAYDEANTAYDERVKSINAEIDTLTDSLPDLHKEKITAKYNIKKTEKRLTDVEEEIKNLDLEIVHLEGKISRYNDFVALNFQDRGEIIAQARDAYGEAFVENFLGGNESAVSAFNRSARLYFAKQELEELQARDDAFENLTDAEYLSTYGETHAETLLSIAALNGYIESVNEQAALAPKFISKVSGRAAEIMARDFALDDIEYMDKALSHYYQAQYAAIPNQDTKEIDKLAKKYFGKYIGNMDQRLRYERQRYIISQRNFAEFSKEILEPVIVGYKPSKIISEKVDELLEEKSKVLQERRQDVLTTSPQTPVVNKMGALSARTKVQVSVDKKTPVREIDLVTSDSVVDEYTRLTMIREEYASKDPSKLTPEDRKILQEVSSRIIAILKAPENQGLLGDFIVANKVATESSIPGYDKLVAFAKAKGLDLSKEADRQLLRSPDMQNEFDKVFPVEAVRQPQDILTELQTFVSADPKLSETIKISIINGKPYINVMEYERDENGNIVVNEEGSKNLIESDKGFPLTEDLLQNEELLKSFGFNPDKTPKMVKQPKQYNLSEMLDERDKLIPAGPEAGKPSLTFHGQVGTFTDLSELEAAKEAELNEAYVKYMAGKIGSYYNEALRIQKKYLEESRMIVKASEVSAAEEYVESVTREVKLKDTISSADAKESTIKINKNAKISTINKKLEIIEGAVAAFKEGPTDDVTEDILSQTVRESISNTLTYMTKYNITAEAVDATLQREDSEFRIDVIQSVDENDPTKIIKKPAIVRTQEDGTVSTYTIGEDNKVSVEVEVIEKTQGEA